MKIATVVARHVSAPMTSSKPVTLAMGRVRKKDAVIVRVESDSGLVGYGESHHGLSPTSVADLINTAIRELVVGLDCMAIEDVWSRVHRYRRSHSLGTAVDLAYSGVDAALWDLKGKALGVGVSTLLGGAAKRFPAYMGGLTLGLETPSDELVEEVRGYVDEHGYAAVKIRGRGPEEDSARLTLLRESLPAELTLLVDANTSYDVASCSRLLPALGALRIGWLEEPLSPNLVEELAGLRAKSPVPLATGENYHSRIDFLRLAELRAVDVFQADVSKVGGVTELKKVGDVASAYGLRFAPHTSQTALNYAATLHVMSAVDASYLYEGTHLDNPFDVLFENAPRVESGEARPPDGAGFGVRVDDSLFTRFPSVPGPAYL